MKNIRRMSIIGIIVLTLIIVVGVLAKYNAGKDINFEQVFNSISSLGGLLTGLVLIIFAFIGRTIVLSEDKSAKKNKSILNNLNNNLKF